MNRSAFAKHLVKKAHERKSKRLADLRRFFPLHNKNEVSYKQSRITHAQIVFGRKNMLRELLTRAHLTKAESGVLFGKRWVTENRRTMQFSDEGKVYRYSGAAQDRVVLAFSDFPPMAFLRDLVEAHTGVRFNFALFNYYTGAGKLGWHTDREPQIDCANYPIVSLSFSTGPRRFYLRDINEHKLQWKFELDNNDLLIMGGRAQYEMEHSVPQQKMPDDYQRINITFRMLK